MGFLWNLGACKSHTKMLKAEPIIELMNGALACNSKLVAPKLNGSILKVNFFQGCGFLVVIIEDFVLVMELRRD